MKIKRLFVLLVTGSIVAGNAYADPAWPVRENKYNLERAKAQAELAKKLEKNPSATPEAVQQMKKELFSEAEKAKEQDTQKVQSTLLSLVLGWKPFEKKSSDETKGGLAESKKDLVKPDEKSGKPSRGSSTPARSTASQNRVTTTGADNVVTGGAEAVSFKGSDNAPSRGASAVGGGDVTSGGAEEIQFGGKK